MGELEVHGAGDGELLPEIGYVAPPPSTLFHSDDPTEIVQKATEIADVLARVLKERKLTSNIQGREHVRVEGWTFCGTMLGVFPVCTWTKPTENGWEARVEARTLAGAVVGAAESSCSRSENSWKNRDDYAIRSMAQTRAVSKALRLPLGFIVSLAGFEVAPAEEMGDTGTPFDDGAVQPFDPASTLLPGAPTDLKTIATGLQEIEPSVDWPDLIRQAVSAVYGEPDRRKLSGEKQQEVGTRLANVLVRLTDKGGDFPPPSTQEIQAAFAEMFEGFVVSIPEPDPGVLSAENADALAQEIQETFPGAYEEPGSSDE